MEQAISFSEQICTKPSDFVEVKEKHAYCDPTFSE